MADMWLPGVERITGNTGGTMTGDGSRKLLLHSTEGSSIAGAVGAYRTNNSWPTLTVDCPARAIVQHLPFDAAARALRNKAGGVQTNREGTILVQIELVGFAGTPLSIGNPDDLVWLGRQVVAPICRATGVPPVSTVRWAAYPGSYGTGASQRLSAVAWDAYNGVLGHQHAPENDHGDPGALNVGAILAAARLELNQENDDMTPEQNKLLERIASAVIPFYQDQKTPDGRFQVQTLVKRALAQYGVPTTVTDTTELVARVEAAVDAAGSVQTAEAWSIADVMRHEVGANPGESTGEAIKRLVGEALADAAR
jgi:hypothetical protein